jgi:hypothetical protein
MFDPKLFDPKLHAIKPKRPFVAPALFSESRVPPTTQAKTFPVGTGDEHGLTVHQASLTAGS